MDVSFFHIFKQGPVIASLIKTAIRSKPAENQADEQKILSQTVAPRSFQLVQDFITHVGGHIGTYKGILPPHMFPQWGFPILAETLKEQPYDLKRILNAGSRLEINHLMNINDPIHLTACLDSVDRSDKRIIFKQKLIVGSKIQPKSMICTVTSILPLKKDKKNNEFKNEKNNTIPKMIYRIPDHTREIDLWQLHARSGLEFSLLTGDFNPVHWIPIVAQLGGFRNVFLHGFSSMARAFESIVNHIFSGNLSSLKNVEVRFIKPIILPTNIRVFVDDQKNFFIGKAQGGPAYALGAYNQ